jgi:vacuolar-type H+-ATPase subunit E/Vma4
MNPGLGAPQLLVDQSVRTAAAAYYEQALESCRMQQRDAVAHNATEALTKLVDHERDLLRDVTELLLGQLFPP